MSTEVERANGAEDSEQPMAPNQAAGESKVKAGKHRPILKTLEFEVGEELSLKLTFEVKRDGDSDGDTPGGNNGPG